MVLGPSSWADVVEKLPSGKTSWEPNGLGPRSSPHQFDYQNRSSIGTGGRSPLLQQLKVFPGLASLRKQRPPVPRAASMPAAAELALYLLQNPHEALVGRPWPHQFVQAQLRPHPLHAPELSTAIEALQSRAHVETEWQQISGWAGPWPSGFRMLQP